MYIDTEGTFRPERLLAIAERYITCSKFYIYSQADFDISFSGFLQSIKLILKFIKIILSIKVFLNC